MANGLRVRRDIDLSRSVITGGHLTSASTSKRAAIWLCESEIGGRLLCVDTIIRADGERAMQADRMRVGGTVRLLHNFTAIGEIRLIGAQIDGSLDLTGASLEHPQGLALDLGDATIGGSVFFIDDQAQRRPVIRGRVDMGSARISGQLLIRNATFEESLAAPVGGAYSKLREGGTAMSAPRLCVGGEVAFEGTCQVRGGIDLSLSEISGISIQSGCGLRAPGRTALDLTNAELRSSLLFNRGAMVEGTVRLTGARIHGKLTMQGVVLSAPQGTSLIAAQGTTIDGDVELQDMQATGGQLRFRSATLGSVIDASGARLEHRSGHTLSLHQAIVKGSVRLADRLESLGFVMLNRSIVEGRLDCRGGSFHCSEPSRDNLGGHAIRAVSASVRGGMYLGWRSITPMAHPSQIRLYQPSEPPPRISPMLPATSRTPMPVVKGRSAASTRSSTRSTPSSHWWPWGSDLPGTQIQTHLGGGSWSGGSTRPHSSDGFSPRSSCFPSPASPAVCRR